MTLLQKNAVLRWLPILIVLSVYIGVLHWLPQDGVWVSDDAIKRLQAQSLAAGHFKDFALPVNGQVLDKKLRFPPLTSPFGVVKNGKLYPVYSTLFAVLNAFFYSIFNAWGLHIVTLIAALWILFMATRIGALLGTGATGRALSVLAIGLATPVWFYSMLIWEHLAAVALVMSSVYYCLRFLERRTRRDIVMTGVLSALAIYFRDELYLWCMVLFFSLFFRLRKERPLVPLTLLSSGMLAALIPLWLFQYVAFGSAMGLHLGGSLEPGGYLASRWAVFYSQILASGSDPVRSMIVSSAFLVAIGYRLIVREVPAVISVVSATVVCIGAALFGYELLNAESALTYLRQSSDALLVSAPVILFAAFGRKNENPGARWLFGVTCAYMVVYALVAPRNELDCLQWGNRFILLVYPLFTILACGNIERLFAGKSSSKAVVKPKLPGGKQRKTEKAMPENTAPAPRNWILGGMVLIVLIESMFLQGISITITQKQLTFTSYLNRYVKSRPEKVLLAMEWWIPQILYSCYADKMIFYIPDGKERTDFVAGLPEKGVTTMLLLAKADDPDVPTSPIVLQNRMVDIYNIKVLPFYLRNNHWETIDGRGQVVSII